MKCELALPAGAKCGAPADEFVMGQWRCIVHTPAGSTSCSHSLAPEWSLLVLRRSRPKPGSDPTMIIHDICGVEVEHLLSDATAAGLVKLRVTGTVSRHTGPQRKGDTQVLLGQLTPDQARQVATHLFEVAARAEYEQDLWRAGKAADATDAALAAILTLVRQGEAGRRVQ